MPFFRFCVARMACVQYFRFLLNGAPIGLTDALRFGRFVFLLKITFHMMNPSRVRAGLLHLGCKIEPRNRASKVSKTCPIALKI